MLIPSELIVDSNAGLACATYFRAKYALYKPFKFFNYNRAATRDVTSVMKIRLPWGKTIWASYGKGAFSLLHVC